MKKKIYIISNRGFIGKTLYLNFKKNNKFKTYGLNSDNCNLLKYSECSKILNKITNEKVSIIFLSTFGRLPKDNYNVYEKNITMIKNFLKSINHKNLEQLIFFSSTCVYGRPPIAKIISEKSHFLHNSYYGFSKYVSENLLKLSIKCPLTIIRVPGVYGSYDQNKSIITGFMNQIINNKKIKLYDSGIVLRDYVYVNDLIKIIKICLNNKKSQTFNFATGKSYKISEIVKLIEKKLNKKSKIVNIKTNHPQFDMIFDNSNFKNNFPKFKITNLDKGIDNIIKQDND